MLEEKQIKDLQARRESKSWVSERLQKLSALDSNLAAVGRNFLGRDDRGKELHLSSHWREGEEQKAAFKRIAKLNEAERAKVFRNLHPKLAPYFEQAWKMFDRLPYQTSYERRPFRAPGNDEALARRRGDWISSILTDTCPFDESITWFAAHAG